MDRWVKLTETWGEVETYLLKGFLEGEGIEVRLRHHVPPSVYPLTVDGLAAIQVWVKEEDYQRALGVLEAYGTHPEEGLGEEGG